MNKTVAILLFTGMVAGCVSSVPHFEQTISKFNPAPVQPASDPIVRTDPFLNDEIWVHWFQLGGTLETHRKSCKTLSGTWNYERESCESPVIPNFGTPSAVFFHYDTLIINASRTCTSSIDFVYIDANHTFLNTWLDYCYGEFGEPYIKDGAIFPTSLNQDWGWKFNNAWLSVGSFPDGFGVLYTLCSYNVPQGPALRSNTGSYLNFTALKMCIDGCRFAAQRCTSLATDSVEQAVCAQKKTECSGLCR